MDYNNILCEAIDTIVEQRLKGLSFDNTVIATIVDDKMREKGTYRVREKDIEYFAFSENTSYRKNDQVYVLTPNGDSSARKIITNKFIPEDSSQELNYDSQLDNLIPMTENLIPNSQSSIFANGDKEEVLVTECSVKNNTLRYSSMILKADFKTLLSNLPNGVITSGTYGLRINAYDKNEKLIKVFTLSSEDMFGNIYNFFSPIEQRAIFKLTDLDLSIDSITVSLFQSGNFKYSSGEKYTQDSNIKIPEIYVSNISLILCNDVTLIEDDSFRIYCDNLSYTVTDNKRSIESVWYNREGNKYIGYKDGSTYEIRWEHLDSNGQWTPIAIKSQDQGTVEPENQKVEITLSEKAYYENVRAVLTRKDNQIEREYRSIPLQFSNETYKDVSSNQHTDSAAIEIVVGKNAKQTYLYDAISKEILNNKLNEEAYLKLLYYPSLTVGEITETDFINNSTIIWRIPEASMITTKLSPSLKVGENFYQEGFNSYLTHSSEPAKSLDEKLPASKGLSPDTQIDLNTQFPYKLATSYYNINFPNNYILCEVHYKNTIYTNKFFFNFQEKGTNGTGYTIIVKPESLTLNEGTPQSIEKMIFIGVKSTLTFKILLYDEENEIVDVNPENITCKYIYRSNQEKDEKKIVPVEFNPTTKNYQIINDSYTNNKIEIGIMINSSGISRKLTKKLPIWYIQPDSDKYKEDMIFLSCIKNFYPYIFYNSQGINPKYYKKLILPKEGNKCTIDYYQESGKIIKEEDLVEIKKFLPSIDSENYLNVPNIYSDTDTPYECNLHIIYKRVQQGIFCEAWIPIIIERNAYENSTINDWDTQLTIDEDNNVILSSMMCAGTKDIENKFSGVLMGKIGSVNGNAIKEGLFGYKKGIQTFGLTTDGDATFTGKIIAEEGQIGNIELKRIRVKTTETEIGSGGYLKIKGILPDSKDNTKQIYVENRIGIPNSSMQLKNDPERYVILCGGISTGVEGSHPNSYPFRVTAKGKLYATDADISGKITATSGTIGGWTIEEGKNEKGIYYSKIKAGTKETGVAVMQTPTLDKDNNLSVNSTVFAAGPGGEHIDYSQCPFRVTAGGKLYATDADIKGKITTSSGKIGNWLIDASSIYIEDALGNWPIVISSSSGLYGNALDSNKSPYAKWYIKPSGKAYFSDIEAKGKITATSGTIGGCKIDEKGKLWVSSANISGTLTATKLNITSEDGGTIAGWTVDNNSIRTGALGGATSMWLCSTGTSSYGTVGGYYANGWVIACGENFGVTRNGYLRAKGAKMQDLVFGNSAATLDTGGISVGLLNASWKWIVEAGIEWNRKYGTKGVNGENETIK